ncbi:MAG: hypothetical protein Q7T82_04750 [Armatimonadota bacterium]|nr:hypothetical protein [Armatimonadota bacterium]
MRSLLSTVCANHLLLLPLAGLLLILASVPALAQWVPASISYQGKLTDTAGQPLSGAYQIQFKLYDTSSGGSPFWTSSTQSITTGGGLFATTIEGTSPPLTSSVILGRTDVWLETSVGGTVLSPRVKWSSVPYALWADYASRAYLASLAIDLSFPFAKTVSGADTVFQIVNQGNGIPSDKAVFEIVNQGSGFPGLFHNEAFGTWAVLGFEGHGVLADNFGASTHGTLGNSYSGVYGVNFASGTEGHLGTPNYGLSASAGAGGLGAANFQGKVVVTGDLSVSGAKYFRIDHPLDPANKYLLHSCVESPEMLDAYSGNSVLDASGESWVELPSYFEALNKDFRYSLTAVGAPGPNLYVAEEIKDNRFKIAGGKPGGKVSWQVTGVRNDAYARKHPIVVEQDKLANERGFYLHPDLYGQPAVKALGRLPGPTAVGLPGLLKGGRNVR